MIDYHNRKIQELTERLYSAQVEFEKSNINEKNLNEKGGGQNKKFGNKQIFRPKG